MNNEEILKRAYDIKEFCMSHTLDEEGCSFFKGYRKEDNTSVVICELNKGQCSPCNWDI